MQRLKDRLTDAGYGLGWSVVCRLPESGAQSAFRFFADLAWRRRGPRVRVLEGNLRRVIGSQAPGGQLRGLSRQAMRSYARYWLEAFRLPVMPAGGLAGGTRDAGHVRAAFEYLTGRPRGGLRPAAHGQLRSGRRMGYRQGSGLHYHRGGAAEARVGLRQVRRVPRGPRRGGAACQRGDEQRVRHPGAAAAGRELVCLVCDRDVTGGGMEVEFFGEKARMMGGAAARPYRPARR